MGTGYSEFEYDWLFDKHVELGIDHTSMPDKENKHWAILKALRYMFDQTKKVKLQKYGTLITFANF